VSAKQILCPIDLSENSLAAVEMATSLAMARESTILFLFVAFPELPASAGLAIAEVDQAIQKENEKFHKITPTNIAVACEHELVRGNPAEEIIRIAEERGVEFIVMSTHGRSGLSRMLMGSVAEEVIRNANCPVLTLRNPTVQSQAQAAG